MRQQVHNSFEWTILEIRDEAPSVRSFFLGTLHERPSFIAGQYLTLQLPNYEPVEGKSYSISSDEKEAVVRLTVQEMGSFSKMLYELKVGDTLITSAPYGFFYPEKSEERDLVFVAGGIGITPCISIIETYCREKYPKNISLFYSNQTIETICFKKRLDELQNTCKQFTVTHNITREIVGDTQYVNGRLSGALITSTVQNPHMSDYFISGSIGFTRSIWKELRDSGISSSQLYTEGFF